jgi:hypothetical protein
VLVKLLRPKRLLGHTFGFVRGRRSAQARAWAVLGMLAQSGLLGSVIFCALAEPQSKDRSDGNLSRS